MSPVPESGPPVSLEGKWFFELITPDLVMMYRVKSYVYSGKTPYQSVEILETESLGRSLVLDGKTQSTTFDEHIYHEALVHPAMLLHPNPQSVFIGGGGEGATLREALAHPTVERVTMVDLDARVVELARLHLPTHSGGALDDPKTQLLHEDARGFLENTSDRYDVMILDLVDPLEEGTAYTLYTREFYTTALGRLNPGGVLVTQSGPGSPLNHRECFTAIVHTLSGLASKVLPYSAYVASFVTPWTFTMALADGDVRVPTEPAEVDGLIRGRFGRKLRFYDGETHRHMFSLPRYLREGIAGETRVVTDANPVFMV